MRKLTLLFALASAMSGVMAAGDSGDPGNVGKLDRAADAAMQNEFSNLNTGRVRNLSSPGTHQSPDAAMQKEFGSLNTGRVRNLTKSQ
jgi:hypothetical protein